MTNLVTKASELIYQMDSNQLKQVAEAIQLKRTHLAKQAIRNFVKGDMVQFTSSRTGGTINATIEKVNKKYVFLLANSRQIFHSFVIDTHGQINFIFSFIDCCVGSTVNTIIVLLFRKEFTDGRKISKVEFLNINKRKIVLREIPDAILDFGSKLTIAAGNQDVYHDSFNN